MDKKVKCSFCEKKSVYSMKYEGHNYCKNHFIKSVEKRVRKTIRENKLVENGDRIVVALSGGKDSSTTLYLLKKIFKNNPKVEIGAMTIDQGFGCVSEYNISFASQLCKDLNVEHHIFSFKDEFKKSVQELVKKNPGSSYCEICGVLRRYLINKKARKLGFNKVATGHNLDDECQSIIMNFIKGDFLRLARVGAKPLLTNHPKFVPRIKPLVKIPEDEVRLFSNLVGIRYSDQKCPYRKFNTFRGHTIEYLNKMEEDSPGIKYSILEGALRLKPLLEQKFRNEKIVLCERCEEPASKRICKTCQVLGVY
ncbi:MAG: TIGR00269 family protein [Candidatus Aenigmatarchaeota archaeon]